MAVTEKVAGKVGHGIIHGLTRTFSVVATLGIIGLIGYSVYVTLIKPHTKARMDTSTTNQSAENISNQYITLQEDNCWVDIFGLKAFCFKNEKVYKLMQKD